MPPGAKPFFSLCISLSEPAREELRWCVPQRGDSGVYRMTTVEGILPRKTSRPYRGMPVGRVLIVLAAVAALLLLGRHAGGYVPRFASWVQNLGAWGPVAFIAGYVIATVAF